MCDDEARPVEPGPEVTGKLFLRWQKARRGAAVAEDMTNPVWEWMFRGRVDPYRANERFKKWRLIRSCSLDFPSEPRWAGCRMGQSHTKLADGREFWIAGEHEDHYDPDFFIYNDVIVDAPGEPLRILGYPESAFRPTDFHSATAIENDAAILIVGNLGYPRDRRPGYTQVYRLDTQTFEIREIESFGDQPGWIYGHSAELSKDGSAIIISGGQTLGSEGPVENIDQWSLRLADCRWIRLTDRRWPRLKVCREGGQSLHLWQYSTLEFESQYGKYSKPGIPQRDVASELAAELGAPPNLDVYKTLYRPSMPCEVIEKDENDDDWRTTHLLIGGVKVRIVEEMDDLRVTVEGDLPAPQIDALVDELRQKLSIVENAPCVVKRIG